MRPPGVNPVNPPTRLVPLLIGAMVLVGCARPGVPATAPQAAEAMTPQAPSSDPSGPTPPGTTETLDSNGMRPGVFPTTRVEPPTDADRPDGPPPTPDRDLTGDQLAALITVPATSPSTPDSCTATDVRLVIPPAEPALGHRYTLLRATNSSGRTCQLIGWPGLGLRGKWGTAFSIVAERNTLPANFVGVPPADPDTAVVLAPGDTAVADVEWTGSLGGASDEHVSLIAVQLTADTVPAALLIDAADPVDIGPDTTVKIGAWGRSA